ncbi:MAG: transglutaminase domain-containing protein [Microbacterium sp.]|nr:transglutaminase domain-containing protein [Microbacterium sp.]
MSRAERSGKAPLLTWHRDREQRPSRLAPSALAGAAALVALWPYTSVIAPGTWSFAVLVVVVLVAATGTGMRVLLARRPAWVTDVATLATQVAVVLVAITMLVAADTAYLGLIPSQTTFATFGTLAGTAWEEVVYGAAPIDATPGIRVVMAFGFAAVAILLDHLLAVRNAVLASILTAVVGAVPMIVTLGDANVVWFVLLGILVLLLFRQSANRDPQSPRRTSTVVAAGVGAVAIAATVIVAPALPVSATLSGTGAGVIVDASLRLGDDLRQPNPVEVLTLATKSDTAPYLRLTTLSRFNGRVWLPDESESRAQSEGFGPAEWGEEVATTDVTTSIRVLRMSSAWLPVPYPATGVEGLAGAWKIVPENRTLTSRTSDAIGNDYTVASERVTPTLEQIRAASAAEPVVDPDAPPVELPEVIGATAVEVTADATNDYDRLVALQSWFRTKFTYSLETPVEEGFDGTGAQAVERFLEVRSGYCVHFAGAFALMAETLGMDVRIVVGYLPGVRTEEKRGAEKVYSVTSDQLHSWPEVLFPGIGWVPFEPTASLGVPTAFSPATTTGGGGTTAPSTPAPTATPGAPQTSGPQAEQNDPGGNAGGVDTLRRLDPTPVALVAGGVLLVLVLPALVRAGVRSARRSRARRGDAGAAWEELRATMIDLQLPVSDADSPRRRGAALVAERGVDAEAMRTLTDAVERASYARAGGGGDDLTRALDEVLHRLHRSVDRPARVRAALFPVSLFASRGADAPLLA